MKTNIFLLLLILLLAALLRLVNLSEIPIGFNDDEAAFGYNAHSILKSGQDEWGKFLPFPVFESFGDWKLVGYLYMVVASQSIFGTGELATRLPSALMGVLAVFATYLLTKELFRGMYEKYNKHDKYEREIDAQISSKSHLRGVSLSSPGPHLEGEKPSPRLPQLEIGNWKLDIPTVAALLLAISPWHIVASRNAFESDILIATITLAAYFFVKTINSQKTKFLTISFVIFAFSFYIYRSSWLFIPLFAAAAIFLFRKELALFKKNIIKNILLAALLLLPLVPVFTTFRGQSRFLQESFITGTSRVGITNEVNERRGVCSQSLPGAFCQIIYNKYIFLAKAYSANYLKNLSYESFFENSSPTGFQSFMKRSAFYYFELPLIAIGIIFLLKQKQPAAKILLPWILLSPVGAAIAGIGNYGRLNLIMPAPQIVAAFGLVAILALVKNHRLRMAGVLTAAVIIGFSLAKLTADIFLIEPYHTSRYQRYGYKQLFDYFSSQETKYDHFYISRKIDNSHQYIQYVYHQKVDPSFFLANVQRYKEKDGWVNVERIGDYNFLPSVPGIEQFPPKSLLAVGEREVTFPGDPAHTINYLNGDPGFIIFDMDKVKQGIKE